MIPMLNHSVPTNHADSATSAMDQNASISIIGDGSSLLIARVAAPGKCRPGRTAPRKSIAEFVKHSEEVDQLTNSSRRTLQLKTITVLMTRLEALRI